MKCQVYRWSDFIAFVSIPSEVNGVRSNLYLEKTKNSKDTIQNPKKKCGDQATDFIVASTIMKILLKPKNVAEAIATYNLLEDNSIHAVIQSCHDTAYDLISQTGNPQTSNIETVRLLMEFFADELEIFIRFKSLS